ncbi:OmpA family protein [Desulfobacterales bacterium HSG2]|nr:OmpA family protein [Desulfobacterales bacterium HSG2]
MISIHTDSGLFKKWCVILIALALTGGCASKAEKILERAHGIYIRAWANQDIVSNASHTLKEARDALEKAEMAENDEEMERLARVAEDKIKLAVVLTERKIAEKQLAIFEKREQKKPSEPLEHAAEKEGFRQREQKKPSEPREHVAEKEGFRRSERGMVLIWGDGLFASGKAELMADAGHQIDRLADFLNRNPDRNVLIEGHTDSTGSDSSNLSLSQHRADAVRAALIKRGVQASRITAKGYGETHPIADNKTEAGRRQNRRVEIIIDF